MRISDIEDSDIRVEELNLESSGQTPLEEDIKEDRESSQGAGIRKSKDKQSCEETASENQAELIAALKNFRHKRNKLN